MSVLTDTDLLKLIADGMITDSRDSSVKASSYDLRVGKIVRKIADPKLPAGMEVNVIKDGDKGATIQPGQIVTVLSRERLKLPRDIAGFVYAPNELSAKGLLVVNPGHIDPGFEGEIGALMINLSETPKELMVGDTFFTIVFQELKQSASKQWGEHPGEMCESTERRERRTVENVLQMMGENVFKVSEESLRGKFVMTQDFTKLLTVRTLSFLLFLASIAGLVITIAKLLHIG